MGFVDGLEVGRNVSVGTLLDGRDEGLDGKLEGIEDGTGEGAVEGIVVGNAVGHEIGVIDGTTEGFTEGTKVGTKVGDIDGTLLGIEDEGQDKRLLCPSTSCSLHPRPKAKCFVYSDVP